MWDINLDYLQKDETLEYSDRPSMLSCIFSYVWTGFMVFYAVMIFIASVRSDTSGMGFMSLLFILFALPAVYFILKTLSTRYAVSNKGVLKRTGIVTASIKTVPFKHITSVEVKETIMGKIFRYAHLLIDTSGSGQSVEFRWNYVNAAHKVKKLIEKRLSPV